MEGSLDELIRDHSFEMTKDITLQIAINCANCLRYFHSCGLIHRDLKSLNILFSNEFKFKLCDFGLSCVIRDNNMTANIGTVNRYTLITQRLLGLHLRYFKINTIIKRLIYTGINMYIKINL